MEIIFENKINNESITHICIIGYIIIDHNFHWNDNDKNYKKIKFTYKVYDSSERFDVEIFNGYKWEMFLDILDLGIIPNPNIIKLSNNERLARYNEIFGIAKCMTDKIILINSK